MSKRVCVIGNLNADLVLYPLEDFPIWGSEVITSHMGWRPGGIGNVLLSLARLGVEVSVIANVGDDSIGQHSDFAPKREGLSSPRGSRGIPAQGAVERDKNGREAQGFTLEGQGGYRNWRQWRHRQGDRSHICARRGQGSFGRS